MQATKLIFACHVILLCSSVYVTPQTKKYFDKSREAEREAIDAYRRKDFVQFFFSIRQADSLRPNHPRLIYNLASACALNKKPDEAISNLGRLAEMGLYFPVEKDGDFLSLLQLPRFSEIKRKMDANRLPVGTSVAAFELSDPEVIPESVAYDQAGDRFFIGSIHKAKIMARDKTGAVREFSSLADGLWSVSGLKVDQKRGVLWACTNAFPQMKGFDPKDDGRSGIFKYSLKTGKLLKKYLLDDRNEKHALGDLTLDSRGNVYASDSSSPVIYRIAESKDTLELFLRSEDFTSLQGMAITPDQKTLFVADYSKGIFRINLQSKEFIQLNPGENITLLGIDGLYYFGGKLIAIQNGVNPQRVIEFTVNSHNSSISAQRTLESGNSRFMEPTLGVVVGEELYYVANSQWPLVNEKAELETERLKQPVILKLKL